MLPGGSYRSPLDDPRGFRKRNKWVRELGKRSPLIALLLLVALLSAVGVYQSKVSRLNGELKAQKHALETARIELSQQTRMGEHSRELAAQRLRDSDRMRHDLDNANRRAKIAEDDNVQKQAVIAHNNKQIEELNTKVQDLQSRQWENANCRSELDMLKARTEHAQRSLQEKELAVSDKDRLLADLQRQVAELQARSSGEPVKADASVPLVRPGWTDPRGTQQQQQPQQPSPSPPPSQLSAEAHAGFAHVATMLTQQGIEDPLGEPHLARTLVQFFEGRMADLIGAEFQDPSAAPEQPMHEQLAATLSSRGITSKHGPEHFQNTVKHMVDAVSHVTGATPVAGTTGQAAHTVGRDQLPQDGHQVGGRKDLGGGEHAHAGGIQQVPAAHLLEQAAAVQGGHHVPPGQDHGWQQHRSNPAAPGVHVHHDLPPGVHPDIHAAHKELNKHAQQQQQHHHKPDAAGFIY
ncbi:g7014 [Coccomyxa elongata]